tara:strand:+ start:26 stop:496 length:471 start_codon:yes stop_codon:yes gene_type:complete
MNMLMLVLVALVALCYFGGNKCPKALKDNKEMLLGVLVGLALCSFMGLRLEGIAAEGNLKMGGDLEVGEGGQIQINQTGDDDKLGGCLRSAYQKARSANQKRRYEVDDKFRGVLEGYGSEALDAYLSAHATTQSGRTKAEEHLADAMVEYARECHE